MSAPQAPSPQDLFFGTAEIADSAPNQTGLDETQALALTEKALAGADDGELFLEYTLSESFSFDDNRLQAASYDTAQGFGLRAIADEATGFAHSSDISAAAIERAGASLSPILSGHSGSPTPAPKAGGAALYVGENPLDGTEFIDKIKLLEDINAYAAPKIIGCGRCPLACLVNGRW